MPNKCCVFQCKSGYAKNQDITLHKFPKVEKLKLLWLKRIARKDYEVTENSRVCSIHFSKEDFIYQRQDRNLYRVASKSKDLKKKYLKPEAMPSHFPSMPSYFSSNSVKQRASISSKEGIVARSITLQNEIEMQREKEFNEYNKINSLAELLNKIKDKKIATEFLHIPFDGFVSFVLHHVKEHQPYVKACISVTDDLTIKVYIDQCQVSAKKYKHLINIDNKLTLLWNFINLISLVKSWCSEEKVVIEDQKPINSTAPAVDMLLSYYRNIDNTSIQRHILFIIEQLNLIGKHPCRFRYSKTLLAAAFTVFNTSSSAYNKLLDLDILSLPSPRTLRKLHQIVSCSTGVCKDSYLQFRTSGLNEMQRNMILMIDEIYVAQRLEYSNGVIVGLNGESIATTVLCFMVKSLCSDFCEVVGLFPVNNLNADTLHKNFLNVLSHLKFFNLHVIVVCVDNATSNRSFYKKNLCKGNLESNCSNPISGTPMYLLIDPTHNIKNIYNCWQRRNTFIYPSFDLSNENFLSASFNDIKDLYDMEYLRPVKMAHKLKQCIFNPKSIERTSVKLSMAVFHESTCNALKYYTDQGLKPWNGTLDFVKLIHKLWSILNVKTSSIGFHKRDINRDPITSVDDWKLQFLHQFNNFLEKWEQSKKPGLSKETFLALKQMNAALIGVTKYLLQSCGFNYVLLGKLQSDEIESRFGWYRQLSGGNYYISYKQLLDAERKIKTMSVLKVSFENINTVNNLDEQIDPQVLDSILSKLDLNAVNITKSDLSIIYYISGYICHSIIKTLKCTSCQSLLITSSDAVNMLDSADDSVKMFLNQANRGGLTNPSDLCYNACCECWKLFSAITTNTEAKRIFLAAKFHRRLFMELLDAIFNNNVQFCAYSTCEFGHSCFAFIALKFFNCMAKNLVKDLSVNEHDTTRKLKKLCNSY